MDEDLWETYRGPPGRSTFEPPSRSTFGEHQLRRGAPDSYGGYAQQGHSMAQPPYSHGLPPPPPQQQRQQQQQQQPLQHLGFADHRTSGNPPLAKPGHSRVRGDWPPAPLPEQHRHYQPELPRQHGGHDSRHLPPSEHRHSPPAMPYRRQPQGPYVASSLSMGPGQSSGIGGGGSSGSLHGMPPRQQRPPSPQDSSGSGRYGYHTGPQGPSLSLQRQAVEQRPPPLHHLPQQSPPAMHPLRRAAQELRSPPPQPPQMSPQMPQQPLRRQLPLPAQAQAPSPVQAAAPAAPRPHSLANPALPAPDSPTTTGLKAGAMEFVPGRGMVGRGTEELDQDLLGGSELKATAGEFVPGRGTAAARGGREERLGVSRALSAPSLSLSSRGAAGDGGGGDGGDAGNDEAPREKMVQVVRNGCIFFVAESEALEGREAGAEGGGCGGTVAGSGGAMDPEGLDWALSSASLANPARRSLETVGVSEQLWALFQRQSLETLAQVAPDDERLKEIPPKFYALMPLDGAASQRGSSGSFGYPSATYKVISHHDGFAYALRRFENVRTTAKIVASAMDRWMAVPPHPGLVLVKEAFLHHGALFFAAEYYACATTLRARLLDRSGPLLAEPLLWQHLCQLASAVRTVHNNGMACRQIDATHVLYLPGGRLKLNWLGCVDVLEYEGHKQLPELQREDMVQLGRLLVTLCCRLPATPDTLADAVAFVGHHYSPHLRDLAVRLLTEPVTAEELVASVASHAMDYADQQAAAAEVLHRCLADEYDNGRILRLTVKMGSVLERPEHRLDPSWSETGDRYVVKLFRDYVFHQVDEEGLPVLDVGHVVHALNKLDAGDGEQILLSSRDQQNVLVVSFADVKRCLEASFGELWEGSGQQQQQQQQQSQQQPAAAAATPGIIMAGGGGVGLRPQPAGNIYHH